MMSQLAVKPAGRADYRMPGRPDGSPAVHAGFSSVSVAKSRGRVLIVDDEMTISEPLSLVLEDRGYNVFVALNGRDGLVQVSEIAPDLIILDFMMPLMNGAEMGRALRAMPATKHIRILMNSGEIEARVREQFSEYDAFLRKPYQMNDLLGRVDQLFREVGH